MNNETKESMAKKKAETNAQMSGRRYTQDVVKALRQAGFNEAVRCVTEGKGDRGDIAGVPGVTFECKYNSSNGLPQVWDQAKRSRDNVGVEIGLVVRKRQDHSDPLDSLVTTDLRTMILILDRLQQSQSRWMNILSWDSPHKNK